MKKIILLLLCFIFGTLWKTQAQDIAVKTNVLYDATTTMNLGVEFRTGHHTSLDISGNYNPWVFNGNKKLKHWLVQPEFRYWTCEPFRKQFFGVHLHGGSFNAGGINLPFGGGDMKDHRYVGYLYGGGVSYGYHWILGGRWGLEATIGAGYARVHYKEYGVSPCSPRTNMADKSYWGITKAGITLVFLIK